MAGDFIMLTRVSNDPSRCLILDNLCAKLPSIAASVSSNVSLICREEKMQFTLSKPCYDRKNFIYQKDAINHTLIKLFMTFK